MLAQCKKGKHPNIGMVQFCMRRASASKQVVYSTVLCKKGKHPNIVYGTVLYEKGKCIAQ